MSGLLDALNALDGLSVSADSLQCLQMHLVLSYKVVNCIGKKLQQKGPDILRYLMPFAIKRSSCEESLFLTIHVTSAVKISKRATRLLSREREYLS